MIIWGTRTFTKLLGHRIESTVCRHCQYAGRTAVVREWVWFTLFFIPLFPVWARYYFVCPNCKEMQKVKRSEAKAAIRQ